MVIETGYFLSLKQVAVCHYKGLLMVSKTDLLMVTEIGNCFLLIQFADIH
jgi:hypothetical protein